jgi:Fe-S-cluster containining protein
MRNETLNYQKAIASPCATCSQAPCCSLLQLQQLGVQTLSDLDLVAYYLNFDNIAVSLSPNGAWTIYYKYLCRFLNEPNCRCSIHNQPAQPNICVHYNPYSCFYKAAHAARHTPGGNLLWVGRPRMQRLQAVLEFDTERGIVQLSEQYNLFALLAEIPYEDPVSQEPQVDQAWQAWKEQSISNDGSAMVNSPKVNRSFQEMQNPCSGCAAYCCQTLLFPHDLPISYSGLDFYKYCLGFPGVELGISNSQWTLIVRTRCRHLDDRNQCSIYGEPERPLICKYYDAGHCTYKVGVGQVRPEGYMKIGYEEFTWILETYQFDDQGNITVGWDTETLRRHVEDKWRENNAFSQLSARR